jgi:hypothetical protein
MSEVQRRFTFIIDDEVELDIEEMLDETPDQADELLIYLEELKGNIGLCEKLIDSGYQDDHIENVKPFEALQRQRYNAYTVRFWNVDDWRVITAVDYRQRLIAILYIMKRTEDYDAQAQARSKAAFERLGLDQLGQ